MRIDHEQARDSFESSPVARLATVRPDGTPHLVPVTFAVCGDVIGTAVDGKPKSSTRLARLRNIAAQPRVCLLVDHYDADWSRLWWVRADGDASVTEITSHPELAEALVAKYPHYRIEPPTGPLITIAVRRWSGWSAAH